MGTASLKVTGMSCDHCARAVTDALQRLDGVERARVDLGTGRAFVDYDEKRASTRELVAAVMDEGYTAEELP